MTAKTEDRMRAESAKDRCDAADGEDRPAYSVVVPAYNAEDTLPMCLEALAGAHCPPAEVVLFDDGSTDSTKRIAQRYGVRVLTNDGLPIGPGQGRNIAVAAARHPIVLFVDADVVIAPEAPGRLLASLCDEPGTAAAFGSYDDAPPGRRVAARYANLRHHHTHRHGEGEAETFWSGLGMVDRRVFLDVGGFDASFERPSIEDVELGMRIRKAGHRIKLVPAAQAAHLKDWTLTQLWHTDVFCRALPWSRLIAAGGGGKTLNVNGAEKRKAMAAHLVWPLFILSFFEPSLLPLAIVSSLLYLALNRSFLKALWANGGPRLAAAGAGLHWVYHLYSSAVFAVVTLASGLLAPMRRRRTSRSSAGEGVSSMNATSGRSQAKRA